MELALSNPQGLICHKIPTNEQRKDKIVFTIRKSK